MDRKTWTYIALFGAIEAEDLLLLRRHLEDADPDDAPWGGGTVLHRAARKDKNDALLELLNRGADPNARSWHDITPLHEAAERGHEHNTEALLKWGADPNARDQQGNTPLHYAASQGRTGIYSILLAHGADLHAVDNYGNTILHSAAATATDPVAVDVPLSRGMDPNAANDDGDTPLHYAADDGRPAMIRSLLAAGADVHAKGYEGRTALQIAGCYRNAEAIGLLRMASRTASPGDWTATAGVRKAKPPNSRSR